MKINSLLKVFFTALLLFTLSLLIYKNDICCMYGAIRTYGFPGQYLILSKETDSLIEARKVNYLSSKELVKQGWKVTFGVSTELLISSSPVFNLIFNFTCCFVISLLAFTFLKTFSCNKKKSSKN